LYSLRCILMKITNRFVFRDPHEGVLSFFQAYAQQDALWDSEKYQISFDKPVALPFDSKYHSALRPNHCSVILLTSARYAGFFFFTFICYDRTCLEIMAERSLGSSKTHEKQQIPLLTRLHPTILSVFLHVSDHYWTGADWQEAVNSRLDTANLILLLVSPDFMASDYCYSIEMQRAMERHTNREARVIPILLVATLSRQWYYDHANQ
jgi:hypothetical protein